jgi:hypothetical protein|tara:strand:- start:1676 stop:1810 length:135 start_codon:yes stop_codon:yes gene_type:complete
MSNDNKSSGPIERLTTGLGLVVLMAIFFVVAADHSPLVEWVVSY